MAFKISTTNADPTIQFAADELCRYLKRVTRQKVELCTDGVCDAHFQIGLCHELAIAPPADVGELDDWVVIKPSANGYLLGGINPRSVLFAVYRYLRHLGIRWLRPGRRGEIVPCLRSPFPAKRLRVAHKPSYRYRTVCIEGATSREHVLDLIDWMAKHGMNGYFLQFNFGSTFFRLWYEHGHGAQLPPQQCNPELLSLIAVDINAALKLRNLRFERMGHGWTCLPLGIESEGWDKSVKKLSPKHRQWLAEVNGERNYCGGVPLNTNLCYSNPDVQRAFVKTVVDYAQGHPEVDALCVWLADGTNNNCECPNCRDTRPADFYVQMLNAMDAALTKKGLDTKLIFLIYVDLLWPPESARFSNPERFILMFAPISRTFLEPFSTAPGKQGVTTPFTRNKLEMPKSAGDNQAYLQAWRKIFAGDGFDFDYHGLWTCNLEPNHVTLAQTLHGDIRALAGMELQGFSSCQMQRLFFPHSLLMNVMAQTLWDKNRPFSAIASQTFNDGFGAGGVQVWQFFRRMSRLCKPFYDPVYLPTTDYERIKKGLANIKKMWPLIDEMRQVAGRQNKKAMPAAIAWSWRYLEFYLRLLDVLLPAYEAYLHGSDDVRQRFERAFAFLGKHEKTLHPVCDVDTFQKVNRWRIHEAENRDAPPLT